MRGPTRAMNFRETESTIYAYLPFIRSFFVYHDYSVKFHVYEYQDKLASAGLKKGTAL